jgi:alginate O-acetyltransferase complex protein AlgI
MVFFRSPTLTSAIGLMKGLIGQNGIALPQAIYDHLGSSWLQHIGVVSVQPELWSTYEFRRMVMWIFVPMLIALVCPNSLQLLARYEPALGVKAPPTTVTGRKIIEWSPSLPWAIGMSMVAASGIFFLDGQGEFLYWQF